MTFGAHLQFHDMATNIARVLSLRPGFLTARM